MRCTNAGTYLSEDGADQAGVLEHPDQKQIDKHRQRQPQLSLPGTFADVDAQRAEPVHRRHQHQEQNILRLSPGVKYQRKYKQ